MRECPHPLIIASLPSTLEANPRSTQAQILMEANKEVTLKVKEAIQEAIRIQEAFLTMEEECELSCRVKCSR